MEGFAIMFTTAYLMTRILAGDSLDSFMSVHSVPREARDQLRVQWNEMTNEAVENLTTLFRFVV